MLFLGRICIVFLAQDSTLLVSTSTYCSGKFPPPRTLTEMYDGEQIEVSDQAESAHEPIFGFCNVLQAGLQKCESYLLKHCRVSL